VQANSSLSEPGAGRRLRRAARRGGGVPLPRPRAAQQARGARRGGRRRSRRCSSSTRRTASAPGGTTSAPTTSPAHRDRAGRPAARAGADATASPPVRDEIVRRLRLEEPQVVVSGFDRPNLALEVQSFREDDQRREAVVPAGHGRGQAGPGLHRHPQERRAVRRGARRARHRRGGLPRRDARGRPRGRARPASCAAARRRRGDHRLRHGDRQGRRALRAARRGRRLAGQLLPGGRSRRPRRRAGRGVLFYRPEDLGLRKFFAGRPRRDGAAQGGDAGARTPTGRCADELAEEATSRRPGWRPGQPARAGRAVEVAADGASRSRPTRHRRARRPRPRSRSPRRTARSSARASR
jgi:hypothetical protein